MYNLQGAELNHTKYTGDYSASGRLIGLQVNVTGENLQ